MLGLLKKRSFGAMTLSQFLGAFNDNAFKQVIVLLATAVAAGAGVLLAPRLAAAAATCPKAETLPRVSLKTLAGRVTYEQVARASGCRDLAAERTNAHQRLGSLCSLQPAIQSRESRQLLPEHKLPS